MSSSIKRFALYGLSGNPPTGKGGHAGVLNYLKEMNRFEEVWVLPVYVHIFSTKRNLLVSYEHRVQMCALNHEEGIPNYEIIHIEGTSDLSEAPQDNDSSERKATNIKVSMLEKIVTEKALKNAKEDELENVRIGTLDILLYLKEQYPMDKFTFILGADTFKDLIGGKWKGSQQILDLVDIIVIGRDGVDIDKDTFVKPPQIEYHEVPSLTDVSSTAIRQILAKETPERQDIEYLTNSLNPYVLNYIELHSLFKS